MRPVHMAYVPHLYKKEHGYLYNGDTFSDGLCMINHSNLPRVNMLVKNDFNGMWLQEPIVFN